MEDAQTDPKHSFTGRKQERHWDDGGKFLYLGSLGSLSPVLLVTQWSLYFPHRKDFSLAALYTLPTLYPQHVTNPRSWGPISFPSLFPCSLSDWPMTHQKSAEGLLGKLLHPHRIRVVL